MRSHIRAMAALGLLLCWAAAAPADNSSEARAIVDRAIKAAGGEENLRKFQSYTWKEKGVYYGMGAGLPYEGTYAVQWPDKFRMEIAGVFTSVLNGDNGWMTMGGQTEEMTKDQVAEQKANHYVGWVTSLLPLRDKAFAISIIGERRVDDQPAVGMRVAHQGRPDVTLWFGQENGRLLKNEYRGRVAMLNNKEVHYENFFSGYQEFQGAWLPTKFVMKRDGEPFVDAEAHDLQPQKFDPSTFSKP